MTIKELYDKLEKLIAQNQGNYPIYYENFDETEPWSTEEIVERYDVFEMDSKIYVIT